MKPLAHAFFNRPADIVARELLGKFIVSNSGGEEKALMINEVEAYVGPEDLACHAARGKTERTKVMFGRAGVFYVYFVYGMHWMLNIVTGKEGFPAAVLIRGAGEISGPAKLTKYLNIGGSFNGKTANPENKLWFEDRSFKVENSQIVKTPRIGVAYAGPVWAKKPLRFLM